MTGETTKIDNRGPAAPRVRRGRRLALLALAAVLGATVAQPALAAPTSDQFGVNAQYLFPFFPPWSVDTHLQLMHDIGLGAVRYDASWQAAEPNPPVDGEHSYDWSADDAAISALASHGLRWLPVLDYSADWDSSVSSTVEGAPPIHPDYFAAYASAFAARYGADGTFWRLHPEVPRLPVDAYEVWNEPNTSDLWAPQADAAAYARLYDLARAAIRGADPRAEVITGGLAPSPDPVSFLRAMLASDPGLVTRVDAVGVHPYAQTTAQVVDQVARIRRALDAAGGGAIPIDVTEVGWTTVANDVGLPWASDADRGADLAWLAGNLLQSDCGVERLLVHTWVTGERDSANGDDWYGIAHPDGTLTASGSVFGDAVHAAESGPAQSGALCGAATAVTPPAVTPPAAAPTALPGLPSPAATGGIDVQDALAAPAAIAHSAGLCPRARRHGERRRCRTRHRRRRRRPS